jgi:hypothetical protein
VSFDVGIHVRRRSRTIIHRGCSIATVVAEGAAGVPVDSRPAGCFLGGIVYKVVSIQSMTEAVNAEHEGQEKGDTERIFDQRCTILFVAKAAFTEGGGGMNHESAHNQTCLTLIDDNLEKEIDEGIRG